jgi:hypothetical protein
MTRKENKIPYGLIIFFAILFTLAILAAIFGKHGTIQGFGLIILSTLIDTYQKVSTFMLILGIIVGYILMCIFMTHVFKGEIRFDKKLFFSIIFFLLYTAILLYTLPKLIYKLFL